MAEPVYRRILVAIDFSRDSIAALGSVTELARQLDAELVLLHVSETLKIIPGSDMAEEDRSKWQRDLDAEVVRLRASGLRARGVLRAGSPVADEILATVEDEGADLLVIGTIGKTILKEKILGSICEDIVRSASCPVLVVRHREPRPAAG